MKDFHSGTEGLICQKNCEGWMVGDWEALTWDLSQMITCHPKKIPKFLLKGGVVQFCRTIEYMIAGKRTNKGRFHWRRVNSNYHPGDWGGHGGLHMQVGIVAIILLLEPETSWLCLILGRFDMFSFRINQPGDSSISKDYIIETRGIGKRCFVQ